MLGKLLKYDLRSVFKYWWIAAVVSLSLAVAAGLLIPMGFVENTKYEVVQVLCAIIAVLCIVGMCLLPLVGSVLIIVRFYKHFFTDEGYLTFTLPVKKHTLLNSKLLMTFIFQLASVLVLILDFVIVYALGLLEVFTEFAIWNEIKYGLDLIMGDIVMSVGNMWILYLVELIIIGVASVFVSAMLIYLCITAASVISKKYKVLVAIGLYYGANSVISFISQFSVMGGNYWLMLPVLNTPEHVNSVWLIAAVLLLVAGVYVAVGAAMYVLENYLLERKLDLQ